MLSWRRFRVLRPACRGRRALKRKGSLAALRDGALFKVAYAWGLRRTELVRLDVCDLWRNPRQPRFGGCGVVSTSASPSCATRSGSLRCTRRIPLRHSYITHLHEENFDPLFVKEQVGHRYMSTTALYTAVSSDYKQTALAAALAAQLGQMRDL